MPNAKRLLHTVQRPLESTRSNQAWARSRAIKLLSPVCPAAPDCCASAGPVWLPDSARAATRLSRGPSGARATVQLYNSEGPFARFFSGLQIHLVSLLHYVY